MSYRIRYDSCGITRYISGKKHKFTLWLFPSCIILSVIVLRYISGMDFHVTAMALENMAAHLKQGSGVQEAFSQFCLDVLQGAQIG